MRVSFNAAQKNQERGIRVSVHCVEHVESINAREK